MTGEYTEVAVIDDPDGLSARITRRKNKNGLQQYSFCFFRRYEHAGQDKETGWMDPRHIPAVVRLTSAVDDRLKLERVRAA